ncbi:MAG: hypothetical protein R3B81_07100 [bacterium]
MRRFVSAVLLATPFVFGACADKDGGPTAPQGSTQAQSQESALMALEYTDAMIADTHELVAGDLTGIGTIARQRLGERIGVDLGRSSTSAIWDPSNNAWVYYEDYNGPEGSFTFAYTIQFFDAEDVPQQNPNASTNRVAYGLSIDMDVSYSNEGSSYDAVLGFDLGMEIGEILTDVYSITGAGAMSGDVDATDPSGHYVYSTDMGWGVDVTVPADGSECATGVVGVQVDGWTVLATYDAANQFYAWGMYEGDYTEGETPVASGSGTSACVPAS